MRVGTALVVAGVLIAAQGDLKADHQYEYARISYVEGGFYLQRAQNYNTGDVGVNTPVGTGDSLWTERGARLEIELDGVNYVRLDENARIRIDSAGATTQIGLEGGSLYLDLANVRSFEVGTPIATARMLENGVYRIDMESGGLVVSTYEGLAEVINGAGSITVRSGQQTQVASGRVPTYPVSLNMSRRDSLDDFQNARSGSLAYDTGYRQQDDYLPAEIATYGYELNNYGSWQYLSPYGYVWRPVGVVADWRPYRNGYWDYIPGVGWTWISNEPWGWAPYHYGRWDYAFGIGWYWIPGRVWGPAWVSWSNWGGYIGWCPLNYYDRPVVCVNNYYGNWWGDNWVSNPDYRSWTFIPKESIGGRDVGHVAVSEGIVKGINRITISKDSVIGTPSGGITRTPIKGGAIGIVGGSSGGSGGGGGNTISVGGGHGGGATVGTGPIIRNEPVKGGVTPRSGGSSISTGGTSHGGTVVPRGGGATGSDGIVYVPPKGTGGSNAIHSDHGTPVKGGTVVVPRGTGGGSGSGGNTIDRSDRTYHVLPAPGQPTGSGPKAGGSSDGESPTIHRYYGHSDQDSNAVTIQRDPEERGYEDTVIYSGGDRGSSSEGNSGTFWGKVYDQFKSTNRTTSGSSGSSGSTVQQGGSSSSRDKSSSVQPRSGSSSAPAVRPAPRTFTPPPPPPPSKSSGGGNKIKKD